jgi:hypothetical protein
MKLAYQELVSLIGNGNPHIHNLLLAFELIYIKVFREWR